MSPAWSAAASGSSVYRDGKSAARLGSGAASVKRTLLLALDGLVCCARAKSDASEASLGEVRVSGGEVEGVGEVNVEERSEYCAFRLLIAVESLSDGEFHISQERRMVAAREVGVLLLFG